MSGTIPGEGLPDFYIQDGEMPELCQNISAFDVSNAAFLDACREFATDPSEENETALVTHVMAVCIALDVSVGALKGDTPRSDGNLDDDVEHALAIATLANDQAKQRMELFSELTPNRRFMALQDASGDPLELSQEEKREMLRDEIAEHGTDAVVESITEAFKNGIHEDIAIFAALASENYEPKLSPAEKRRALLKTLGEHALDVTKIAAGTALALWFMNRKRR